MATLSDSVTSAVQSTADFRKSSVDEHRAKDRKKRYRNVNTKLLGQPINPFSTPENPKCELWNDRNKFKMPNPNSTGGRACQCLTCRNVRYANSVRGKARMQRYATRDDDYSSLTEDTYDQDNIYRDGVDGVLYSYDRPTGPSHGSQILTQALTLAIDKHETKQFEKMVKSEYDIVESEESGSSEDDDYELV